MDLANLKLEVYDLIGLLVPGAIAISEGWAFWSGWQGFVASLGHVSAAEFALLVLLAFPLGNVVQELGDFAVKHCKGQRFFRKRRDEFWESEEAEAVKRAIRSQFGQDACSVDAAFDYCLSASKGNLAKRDVFLATSDLCRSLTVLCVLGVGPVIRDLLYDGSITTRRLGFTLFQIAVLSAIAALSWRRMVRFRALSEITVFRTYITDRAREVVLR